MKNSNWPLKVDEIEDIISKTETAIKKDYPEFKASNYKEVYFAGDTLNPSVLFYTPFTYSTDSNYYGTSQVSYYKNEDVMSIESVDNPYKNSVNNSFEPIKSEEKKEFKRLLKKLKSIPELDGYLNIAAGDESVHILKVFNGYKLYYRSSSMGDYEEIFFFITKDFKVTKTHHYTEFASPNEEYYSWRYKLVKVNF